MKKSLFLNGSPTHDIKPSNIMQKDDNEKIIPGVLRGGEEIKPGTLHGGEEILPGTLHGGEEILPGTLHVGEEILPGTLHGGEEILPGTLHGAPGTLHNLESRRASSPSVFTEKLLDGTLFANYGPATYRTKDGSAFYKFRYIDIGGKFEVDIIEQPSYRHRAAEAHITHRLPSIRGGQKICIASGHEPTSLDGAKKISMQWAELTHEYIRTGRTLDEQISQAANRNNSSPQPNSNNSSGGFWEWLFG